ncbi:MAG: hypothetical protein V3W22_00415 [Thermoplasmata archaeon]
MLEEAEEKQDRMSTNERLRMLKGKDHKGVVRSLNPRQKISDEELLALFGEIKGKWFYIDDLKDVFDGLIKINTDDPKRTPINSSYFRRLRRLTGRKWRQKRGVDEGGRTLVKIYIRKG